MNILIAVSSLNYGGAEKQAVLDANMLAESYTVFLVYFQNGPLEVLIDKKVKQIQLQKGNYLVTAFRLNKVTRGNKIEIIHASLFAAMIISALSSIFSGTKIIWHFHSHEYDMPYFNGLLLKWMGRLPSVGKILFVSEELQTYLNGRFKFPDIKIGLLYNTASFEQSLKVKRNSGQCTIGYIGRLVGLKRVNLLIECAEYLLQKGLDHFLVNIIGDGQMRANLEELTEKRNLDNIVKFFGFQSDTEKYYNEMDIFALPSGEECLSMAAIDAGVKGTPIVAFNVGGNSEIIDSGKTGFIVTTNEEFFEKIHYLTINKNICDQMGEAAAVYCSDKFGKEKHLFQLNKLYSEMDIKHKG